MAVEGSHFLTKFRGLPMGVFKIGDLVDLSARLTVCDEQILILPAAFPGDQNEMD